MVNLVFVFDENIESYLFQLLCRTAIALEQEKVIESNVKELEELRTRISATNLQMDKLMNELDSMTEKYESNETALKDRDETIKNNNMGNYFVYSFVITSLESTNTTRLGCFPSFVLLCFFVWRTWRAIVDIVLRNRVGIRRFHKTLRPANLKAQISNKTLSLDSVYINVWNSCGYNF